MGSLSYRHSGVRSRTKVLLLVSICLLALVSTCCAVTLTNTDGTWGGVTPSGVSCIRNTDGFSVANTIAWPYSTSGDYCRETDCCKYTGGSTYPPNPRACYWSCFGSCTSGYCSCTYPWWTTPYRPSRDRICCGEPDAYPYPPACPDPSVDTSVSGYSFVGVGTSAILPGQIFQLGEFCHYNHPISNSITGAVLSVYLKFGAYEVGPIDYNMDHLETPNSCTGCPFTCPSSGCPDRVMFSSTSSTVPITVEGKTYNLEILGFSPDCNEFGSVVNQFITQENANNCACLYARLTGTQASIFIKKLTNDIDVESADDIDKPIIAEGCPVTWKYLVSNDGNMDLTSISVTDNQPGVTPAPVIGTAPYNIGDLDKDNVLDLIEVWEYTAVGTAISCPEDECGCEYSNTATATGVAATTPPTKTATDMSYYRAISTVVNAGADKTICESPGEVELSGTSSCPNSLITYEWTSTGDGSFSSTGDPLTTTTYTLGTNDKSGSSVTITLNAKGSCGNVLSSDEMTVTIVDVPVLSVIATVE